MLVVGKILSVKNNYNEMECFFHLSLTEYSGVDVMLKDQPLKQGKPDGCKHHGL